MKNKILFSIVFSMAITLLFVGFTVFAQENNTTTVTSADTENETIQEVESDQTVTPEDLEIKEPKLLPTSPFYFAKDWWRDAKLFFAFNPIKKAELRQKIADEKLLELKKMAEQGVKPKILEKAEKSYENQQKKLQAVIEKLKKRKIKRPARLESFKEKFTRHQILHNKILEKLEGQVPEQAYGKIKEMRERHLQRFGETMFKLEDEEKIPQRLEKAFQAIKGSDFKDFKALEFLREVRGKIQDESKKERLQQAEEKIIEKFKTKIEQLPPKRQERIKIYIENLPGNKVKQLEILEELRERVKDKKELREKLEQGREKLLERMAKKGVLSKSKDCPLWTAPAPGFCKEGRIVIKKDEKGCPLSPICIVPGQIEGLQKIKERLRGENKPETEMVCTQIWDPVCGENGKTYSNACFARIAGQKIAHKGICKNIESSCAEEGQRVNRNPLLGPTNKACCRGLVEERVSRSYSICKKAITHPQSIGPKPVKPQIKPQPVNTPEPTTTEKPIDLQE